MRKNWKAAVVAGLMLVTVFPIGASAASGAATDDKGNQLPQAAGTFTDDDGSIFEADIEWLASTGITKGCGGTNFCPDNPVTRGQMAAFLVRALGLKDNGGGDLYTDDDNSIFENDIDKLGTSGITKGCGGTNFCPDDVVTRGQMAAFLVRGLDLKDNGGGDLYTDDDNSIFENDIDILGTSGITKGCGGTNFCPDDVVTRGQMAAFLHRALKDLLPSISGSLPNGYVGKAYSRQLTMSGGTPPLTATKVSGPAWASVSSTAKVTGTPTAGGNFTITVKVTDNDGYTATRAFSITIIDGCAGNNTLPNAECQALSALYFSTNGASWTDNTGWLSGDPCTPWYGVICIGGHVEELNLDGNNLQGPIPDLTALTGLKILDLRDDLLTGSIPTTLGSMASLQFLRLDGNQLTGAIPSELGNISTLTRLGLGANALTGNIPTTLGNLSNLEDLDISGNSGVNGSIPTQLGNLSNLITLDLGETGLTGTFPTSFADLDNLVLLHLDFLAMSGSIPMEIGDMASLQILDLEGNEMSGQIPDEFGDLSNLAVVFMADMPNLNSTIPTTIIQLTNLEYLDMSGSGLTGLIPTNIGDIGSSLGLLDLSNNSLGGEIPGDIQLLTGLTVGTLLLDDQGSSCFTFPDAATETFVTGLDPGVDVTC
jgi:Leucine-rich repeat (LRR) protein